MLRNFCDVCGEQLPQFDFQEITVGYRFKNQERLELCERCFDKHIKPLMPKKEEPKPFNLKPIEV